MGDMRCARCAESKDESLFGDTARKAGAGAWCRECYRVYHREWYLANKSKVTEQTRQWRAANPEKAAAANTRNRAKRVIRCWNTLLFYSTRQRSRVLACTDFDLTPDFIQSLYARQGGLCHWFGIPMLITGQDRHPQKPSVDRLDNARGYTKDNVVLACHAANMGRSKSTAEEWVSFVKLLRATWSIPGRLP